MSDSNLEPGGAPPSQPNSLNPNVLAGATLLPGTPVYIANNSTDQGVIGPAKADSASTAQAVGISLISAANGERGQYRYSGPITLPEVEWAAVLNTGTKLTPGATYYVSQATAGKLTLTKPGSGIVCSVGYATSSRTLLVQPSLQVTVGG